MKKIAIILFSLISYFSFSQIPQFEVTPTGLSEDGKNHIVIDVPDKSAAELYKSIKEYIYITYKNPDHVLKSDIENELLRFDTFDDVFVLYNNSGIKVPITVHFTTEVKFKDGKVRIEYMDIDMSTSDPNIKMEWSGSIFNCYPIYKKNGKLFKEETKKDVEAYFNGRSWNLYKFMTGKAQENLDDW